MSSIRPMRLNHINVVLQHFQDSVAHFERLYGAEFMVDMPQREMHASSRSAALFSSCSCRTNIF